MPTHVIYARKSTESDDRQVLSIDSQVQELHSLASRRGLVVHEVLKEARSAKAPGRPVFGSLMQRIGRGEIGAVLCWKMDRLARNHLDTGHVLQALADGKLERVVTPEREYTTDGNDRFLGNFELGIATKFIDDLRANVRRGNRARFQLGWPNFRPPIGYVEDRSGPTTIVVPDKDRFPIVRQMWDLLLQGRMTPVAITRWAEAEGLRTRQTARLGGKPLTFQYIYRLFANPYYMGLLRLKSGETYRGAHPPMITPEEFAAAQEILGRPTRTHQIRHVFAYAGLLACGLCGRSLVPEEHTKPSGKRFVYYRCRGRFKGKPCPNPSLPEAALERQFAADLRRLRLSSEAMVWIRDNLRDSLHATLESRTARRRQVEQALAAALRESDALLTLKLRGQVDEEAFERRRLGLLDRQASLRLTLERPAPTRAMLLERVEKALRFSVSLPEAFREGDPVRRREIFHAICANPIVKDRKALYTAKEPWSFFENARDIRSWCSVVERLRTWIVAHDFQIPPSFTEIDLGEESLRRSGTIARRRNKYSKKDILQEHRETA